MDTRFTRELREGYEMFRKVREARGTALPSNAGTTPDKKLRRLDCAVLNFYLTHLERRGARYDTVRCGFVEGKPAFDGSGISEQSHVQLAVRNPTCIVGVFAPRMEAS